MIIQWLRSRRGMLALLLLTFMLPFASVAGAASYYTAVPTGLVGIATPSIGQRWALGADERITGAEMLLDGRPVNVTWDETGWISHTPDRALAVGEHQVKLTVRVTGPTGPFNPVVSEYLFRVAPGALAVLPALDVEGSAALRELNTQRRAAGMSEVTYSPALASAAVAHAKYLAANPAQSDRNAHGQTPGTPQFIGATPGERVGYFGYGDSVGEVVHYLPLAEEAVSGWLETLYHRIPLVHPNTAEAGYGYGIGAEGFVNVMETGSVGEGSGVSRWPYSGQTGVPTGWDGLESPDPLALYPGVTGPVGYTVTLTFGRSPRSLRLGTWRLVGPSGAVEVLKYDPVNDPHLKETVALIPRQPLEPGATYRVELAGQVDYGTGAEPFSERWSFTTAPNHSPDPSSRVFTTRGSSLEHVRVDGTGFHTGMKVYLGGLPVTDLKVESLARISFKLPLGFDGGPADLLIVSKDGGEVVWTDFLSGNESFVYPAGTAMSSIPLTVRGTTFGSPAYRHAQGALLIPESALTALGRQVEQVSQVGRSSIASDGLVYVAGRTISWVDGEQHHLPLPVQVIGGIKYLPATLLEQAGIARAVVEGGTVRLTTLMAGPTDLDGHWARDAIATLVSSGVVNGYPDGTFRPDETLTRSAFMKMLVAAQGLPLLPGDTGGMADMAGHWTVASGYVGAAVKAGLILPQEYPGLKFLPEQPITREEIAVMVTRSLGLDAKASLLQLPLLGGSLTVGERTFTDGALWKRPGYVALAVERGIVTGIPDASGRFSFQPARAATRAEAAVMLLRRMQQ